MIKISKNLKAFTLPEILIAVSIFSVVALVTSTLYIQSFRTSRDSNYKRQIFEDARYVIQRLAEEIRNGTVDYDEYYNQYVVRFEGSAPAGGIPFGAVNYGQNFGRYYSSFFNPGNDEALGFDCNTVRSADGSVGSPVRNSKRNERECTPLKTTTDRNTGSNPFFGKAVGSYDYDSENAFCGTVSYNLFDQINKQGEMPNGISSCDADLNPLPPNEIAHPELYLVSADGMMKTILARETIGTAQDGSATGKPVYALSRLRMQGVDINEDGIADRFICADGFECVGTQSVANVDVTNPNRYCSGDEDVPGQLPRSHAAELESTDTICDTKSKGFAYDFVPISPLSVNISQLEFYITPTEDPHYAFDEQNQQQQPSVTIIMTVEPNPTAGIMIEDFQPITLMMTVFSRIGDPVPEPLLINPSL